MQHPVSKQDLLPLVVLSGLVVFLVLVWNVRQEAMAYAEDERYLLAGGVEDPLARKEESMVVEMKKELRSMNMKILEANKKLKDCLHGKKQHGEKPELKTSVDKATSQREQSLSLAPSNPQARSLKGMAFSARAPIRYPRITHVDTERARLLMLNRHINNPALMQLLNSRGITMQHNVATQGLQQGRALAPRVWNASAATAATPELFPQLQQPTRSDFFSAANGNGGQVVSALSAPAASYAAPNFLQRQPAVHQVAVEIDPCKVLVTLVTTFMDNGDPRKEMAQENALRSFARLSGKGLKAYLFTDSPKWTMKAKMYGIEVVDRFETNSAGTPLLNYMYNYIAHKDKCPQMDRFVLDGYTNGDIIFTEDLLKTAEAVKARWGPDLALGKMKGVLLIGKRLNVDLANEMLSSDDEVRAMATRGELFQNDAEDYFIYSRGWLNWNDVPNFVVGRRSYDNWLVDHAVHTEGVATIDCSNTVTAVHLTASDGIKAGHNKGVDNDHNINVLNPLTLQRVHEGEWDHGSTDDARYFSITDGANGIGFQQRYS
ncbi:hypothetical protein GUITHDRAFT_100839 [Guillardia theta CCMP2712]|uniref:Uncharacterized protein n=2 Tax=Guillardia theta TaxID=55529 RepID=L1K0I4_GUITC|nr:hypothetical protein GUITHDRAFT_100839 [Guillardia theta CCMP2712]EKX53873.1 hypothetical protein GUITHDRAFT_100839 [Guillardia theta CCMP2712]|mmetsp:Transcript_14752/g.50313  ORF Transcript_14752/g.50313 Transcript_14752/m.50313 type:complete len:546 (+) Transcript_14752:157-1794(+)|eukprot:XP_005840853.1 hypothetical protein GUITHDRAFT_100839 [Guillardia theta CCMP2712]